MEKADPADRFDWPALVFYLLLAFQAVLFVTYFLFMLFYIVMVRSPQHTGHFLYWMMAGMTATLLLTVAVRDSFFRRIREWSWRGFLSSPHVDHPFCRGRSARFPGQIKDRFLLPFPHRDKSRPPGEEGTKEASCQGKRIGDGDG